MTDLIATDHPLTEAQLPVLAAVLDTLVPASEDGRLPSAASLDFVGYLIAVQPEYLSELASVIDEFDDVFAGLALDARVTQLTEFSNAAPERFHALLMTVYACYYEDDGVKAAIGLGAGAPFPRGNTVTPGDLTLLDPVVAAPHHYRKA